MENINCNVLAFWDKNKNFVKVTNINICYVDNIQDCLYRISVFPYDAVLIQTEDNTFRICQMVSSIRSVMQAPIIVFGDDEIAYKEKIIYAGADIIVKTSISCEELRLIIFSLVRRYTQWHKNKKETLDIMEGKLTMKIEKHAVYWNDCKLYLTKQEYDFLYLLASSPRRIYTFEQIYQLVWKDYPVGNIRNIIWCLVKRLRKKLNTVENDAGNCIVSVRDIGYKFELNKEHEKL